MVRALGISTRAPRGSLDSTPAARPRQIHLPPADAAVGGRNGRRTGGGGQEVGGDVKGGGDTRGVRGVCGAEKMMQRTPPATTARRVSSGRGACSAVVVILMSSGTRKAGRLKGWKVRE